MDSLCQPAVCISPARFENRLSKGETDDSFHFSADGCSVIFGLLSISGERIFTKDDLVFQFPFPPACHQ